MSFILTVLSVIIIILLFVNFKYGFAVYLAYSILVPIGYLVINNFLIGEFFIFVLLLLAFIFRYIHKFSYFKFKLFTPFLFLLLGQFILIPFHNQTPFYYQLNSFVHDMMGVTNSLILLNVILLEQNSYKLYIKVIFISIAISTFYGLFLTTIPGINPYLLITLPIGGQEFNAAYAAGNSGLSDVLAIAAGRNFGRISSVFTHPMTYGIFLCLSLVFMLYTVLKSKNKSAIILLLFIVVNIFCIGVRTSIVVMIISLIYYLCFNYNIKKIFYTLFLAGIIYIIISNIIDTSSVFNSILSKDSDGVEGSSLNMRLEQLQGCFTIIDSHLILGNGYGWTSYYLSLHATHPLLLSFESLAFVILCNNGLFGVLLWLVFIFMYFKISYKFFTKEESVVLQTLLVVYLCYSLITGEYGYMKYLVLYYAIFIGIFTNKKTKTSINI
ncbi:O-antigen ligase family protein [uncultured Bacteroides sp.]|uniref:O-antigen ligase family protein n=1 Tax=uncultured Bacteroides sp. TaxID=162156 RepID=UPI002AABF256|nr:O-antigen ligase family protein [uncultured Bacteroides sp.]